MAARTTSDAVKLVLMDDYGARNDGSLPSLTPFIDTAAVVVDQVVLCAARKGKTVSNAELELIERWLAAHFYGQSDKPYANRSTQGASGAFHGQTAMGLDSTLYGQTAKRVDPTGCLDNIDQKQRASARWIGKRRSEQTNYKDRN